MANSNSVPVDSTGNTVLTDSHKRKSDSRCPTPPPSIYSIKYPRTDLGRLIETAIVPEAIFQAIQQVILDQHDLIHKCSNDMKGCNEQIYSLGDKLKDAVAKADRNQELLEKARATADLNENLVERKEDEIASLRTQLQKATARLHQGDRMNDQLERQADNIAAQCEEILYLRRQLYTGDEGRKPNSVGAEPNDIAKELEDTRHKLYDMQKQFDNTKQELSACREVFEANRKSLGEDTKPLLLGREIVEQKTQEATGLTNDNNALRQLVVERDSTITHLYNQIARLGAASADEKGLIALETQAERTLARIRDLEASNAALIESNGAFKVQVYELQQIALAADDAVSTATERANEAQANNEDQDKLI